MNDEQQRIWDYLNQNAVGYDNRKSSSEIWKWQPKNDPLWQPKFDPPPG